MNHELAIAIELMRRDAQRILRDHAREHCRLVSQHLVDSVAQALGDVSLDEGIAALDRIQAEAALEAARPRGLWPFWPQGFGFGRSGK